MPSQRATIGVSIAVPEPWGSELQDYRTLLGDQSARLIPTHITLLPPYDLPEGEVDAVTSYLADVAARHQSFEVMLRGTGTFRPVSPVVFVGVAAGISQLELLSSAVRRGPFDMNAEFPYHPHVTIAHHLEDPLMDRAFTDLADFECTFEVREFWLYRHDDNHGWRPTRSFELS